MHVRALFAAQQPASGGLKPPSQAASGLGRPEVEEAISQGIGVNFRHSTTLDLDMVYVARIISLLLKYFLYAKKEITIIMIAVPTHFKVKPFLTDNFT